MLHVQGAVPWLLVASLIVLQRASASTSQNDAGPRHEDEANLNLTDTSTAAAPRPNFSVKDVSTALHALADDPSFCKMVTTRLFSQPRPRPFRSAKCITGQIDKSMTKSKKNRFKTKANSYEECLQECRNNADCKAFDYTTDYYLASYNCRCVKEVGKPRIGGGGRNKRQFCVMDGVDVPWSAWRRKQRRKQERPRPSSSSSSSSRPRPHPRSKGRRRRATQASPRPRRGNKSPRPRPRPRPRPHPRVGEDASTPASIAKTASKAKTKAKTALKAKTASMAKTKNKIPRPRPSPSPSPSPGLYRQYRLYRPSPSPGLYRGGGECSTGQIDKRMAGEAFKTKANSYQKCLQECRDRDDCIAFDYTVSSTNTDACRCVKEVGNPRLADGGSDKRQFCVMEGVEFPWSALVMKLKEAKGTPVCHTGQIQKSMTKSCLVSPSDLDCSVYHKANSVDECYHAMLVLKVFHKIKIKAFDFVKIGSRSGECRGVKVVGKPRIGDGGEHKRQFCVMDVVDAPPKPPKP